MRRPPESFRSVNEHENGTSPRRVSRDPRLVASGAAPGRRGSGKICPQGGRPADRIQGQPAGHRRRKPRLAGGCNRRRGVAQSAYEIRVAAATGLRSGSDRCGTRGAWHRMTPSSGLRGAGAAVGPALLLAGARVGRGRAAVGLERARASGKWACWTPATGRPAGSSPTVPEDVTEARARRPCCAATSRSKPAPSAGARLRDQPRAVRDAAQRPARGRRAVHARLDQLQQAASVPDLRRDRPAASGRQRGRRDARRRLVSRPPGLAGPAQHLRRHAGAAGAAQITYEDGRERDRGHRRRLESRHRPDPDVRDLRRRDLRRAAREAGLDRRRLRRRRLGGRQGGGSPARTTSWRPPGPPVRRIEELQAGQDLQDPGRRHRGRHGPEHGRLGAAQARRGRPARP